MPTVDLPIVDAHHHLWDLDVVRYPWLSGESAANDLSGDIGPIRRNYGIQEYLADCDGSGVIGSVHVQAECDRSDPVSETRWLQQVADQSGFPQGIVAFVALDQPNAHEVIEAHCQYRNVRGIRYILNWHEEPSLRQADRPDYVTDRKWRRGLAAAERNGLSFDLQIYPSQMPEAAELARDFPNMRFVLNHAGMPMLRDAGALEDWSAKMAHLAECDNVAVKISGLMMLDHHWTPESVRTLTLRVIDIFGPERCMFGSNFPIDRLYCRYDELVRVFREAIADLSTGEQRLILSQNAVTTYGL